MRPKKIALLGFVTVFVCLSVRAESATLEKDGYQEVRCATSNSITFSQLLTPLAEGKFIVVSTFLQPPDSNFYVCVAKFLSTGETDPAFNGGMPARYLLPGSIPQIQAAYPLSGDKLLIATSLLVGEDFDFGLFQILSDGTPDPNFGKKGIVTTDLLYGTNDFIIGSAVLPDGKILLTGSMGDDDKTGMAMAQYFPNGDLDPDFAEAGRFTKFFENNVDAGGGLLRFPDGMLYVFQSILGPPGTDRCVLRRFTAKGVIDLSFGKNGEVEIPGASETTRPMSIRMTPTGKMMVGLFSDGPQLSKRGLRLVNLDGSIDKEFGKNGYVDITAVGAANGMNDFIVAPTKRILMVKRVTLEGKPSFRLVRLYGNGDLDNTFGTGGSVTFAPGGLITGQIPVPVLMPDGKIFVTITHAKDGNHALIIRFTADGKLDTH